jgi:putative methyltransferase (TIGR04325 family)
MVRDGRAAAERDGAVFSAIPYSFPLLSGLLRTAVRHDSALVVLDFGGSLGSSYYQCRPFLNGIRKLTWCVIEQPMFVECGRKDFETNELRFYGSIEEAVSEVGSPGVVLLSGVLQYLEDPWKVLRSVGTLGASCVIIDRTPVSTSGKRWVTVQVPARGLYSASYPAWIFDEAGLLDPLRDRYAVLATFDALEGRIGYGKRGIRFVGMILEAVQGRSAQNDMGAQRSACV